MSGAWIQGVVEPLPDVELVAGYAPHHPDLSRDTLLQLEALIGCPILVADETTTVDSQIENSRMKEFKESRGSLRWDRRSVLSERSAHECLEYSDASKKPQC